MAEADAPAVPGDEKKEAEVVGVKYAVPVVHVTAGTHGNSNISEVPIQSSEDEDGEDADLALFLPADIALDLPSRQIGSNIRHVSLQYSLI